MDITSFLSWFLDQILNIFTQIFNILDSIKFFGTSLLYFIITIIILGALVEVVLTLSKSTNFIASKAEKVKQRKEKEIEE